MLHCRESSIGIQADTQTNQGILWYLVTVGRQLFTDPGAGEVHDNGPLGLAPRYSPAQFPGRIAGLWPRPKFNRPKDRKFEYPVIRAGCRRSIDEGTDDNIPRLDRVICPSDSPCLRRLRLYKESSPRGDRRLSAFTRPLGLLHDSIPGSARVEYLS
jgi:hypothetical protein